MPNPSLFAGSVNALEFAYGTGGSRPGPLVVTTAPTAVGAGSLTLQFGYSLTDDGRTFSPLATTAPITVGSGGNAETVTPSAVSVPTPGILDSTTVTATFANLHGRGDRVSSGTFGLQEAINYQASRGGGTVIVDNRWTAAGGTTAILNAATLPAAGTVNILDNRGGGGSIQTLIVTVSNAEVKTLFSVGKAILPAPGAGNAYDIIDMFAENKFLTAAFAAGGAIQLSYGNGVTTPASATIAAAFLTGPVADQSIKVAGALASSLSSLVVNAAITLAAATADFTTGAGSLRLRIAFRVVTGL